MNEIEDMPIQIDPLSPKQAAQAGELLTASHADYPSFRHLFPDTATRCHVLRQFMAAAARDAAAHGRALVAHEESGFLSVALWMPPGSYPLSLRRKLQMTPALLRVAMVTRGAFLSFARVGATQGDTALHAITDVHTCCGDEPPTLGRIGDMNDHVVEPVSGLDAGRCSSSFKS